MGYDFAVSLWRALLERPYNVKRDMIASRNTPVQIHPKELRWASKPDAAFFQQLACECGPHCFADFNAAARQVPTSHIAVLYEKHASFVVNHNGTHANRHSVSKAPIQGRRAANCLMPRAKD